MGEQEYVGPNQGQDVCDKAVEYFGVDANNVAWLNFVSVVRTQRVDGNLSPRLNAAKHIITAAVMVVAQQQGRKRVDNDRQKARRRFEVPPLFQRHYQVFEVLG